METGGETAPFVGGEHEHTRGVEAATRRRRLSPRALGVAREIRLAAVN